MSNSKTRSRSQHSGEFEFEQPSPLEVGETNLDLDDISQEDLDNLFLDEKDEEQSIWNVPTISGLTIILVGIIYLLGELGLWTGPDLTFAAATLPIIGGILIILLGFGVLSWRPKKKREKSRKKKAIDADTGRKKVVEEPAPKEKKKMRLTRSRRDKKLFGVCGGIADALNIDSTLVRIAFVVGTIFTSGVPFIIGYLALAYLMPKEAELTPEERIRIIREES